MAIITNTTSFSNLYSNKNRATGDSLPNPSIGSTWYDAIADPSNRFDNVQVGFGASAFDTHYIKAYVGFAQTTGTYTIARQYSNWLEATNLSDKMPDNKNVQGILIRLKKSTNYDYPAGDYAGVKDVNAFISYGTPETISTSNKALTYRNDIWPTSGTGYTDYRGSTDLWGFTSLTTTQLNSSDFKFLFQVSWDEQGIDKKAGFESGRTYIGQYGGAKYAKGGNTYTKGKVYSLTMDEINEIKRRGGSVKFIK